MVKDHISELIISLKNASAVGHESVETPYTKMKSSVLDVLKKEGYVGDIETLGEGVKKNIHVELKYDNNGAPAITDAKRVSKFSRRIYKGSKEIFPVKNGYGLMVLTTPNGVMSGKQARKENVGGEVLFQIW